MTSRRAVFWALALLLAIRLLAMVWLPLTDPTEARYAEIARKMVETGNWITPQFDYGVPFWAKPPLHTWLSAAGIALLGPTPFAARLGILLAAIGTLLILWRWALTLTDRKTAAIAVLVTVSSFLFFGASAFVMTDMVMTLGITACMAGFYGAIGGLRRWSWLFFLGLAIGLLAKGPVATVLSLAPITAWMIWRGGWRDLGRLPWRGGLALVAVLAVPWYVAAEIATPGFLHYFLIGEHIQRFLQPGWTGDLYGAGRAHPRGTIWIYWLIAALPWSLFLPALIWRLRRGVPKSGGLHLYLLLFALAPLGLFTLAANVLLAYVLPGLPAAGLLGVLLWRQTGPAQGRALTAGVALVAVLFAGLTVGARFVPDRLDLPAEAPLIAEWPGPGRLAILGGRSFSAEFATQGKITRLRSAQEAGAWARPGDGILVPSNQDLPGLTPLASDHRYRLMLVP